MLANVTRLWTNGRQVPRYQLSTLKSVQGDLRMGVGTIDDYLQRHLRTAQLMVNGEDVLPPLHDAAVLSIKLNTMTITGFERDFLQAFAQTWYVEIVAT